MTKLPFSKKGGLVFPVIFILAGFFIFNFVFAYGHKNTHPALTYEVGQFYNMNAGDSGVPDSNKNANALQGVRHTLSSEEIDWLMQGSEDEDIPPRWINHFYNPITGEGWNADKLGDIDKDIVEWFSKFALSSRKPVSAKNWAKNISAQTDYVLYDGNQTWQRATDLYILGDREGAFKALGHTLHLLEDMTVPDHTRNDTHAGLVGDKGSPYEIWAESYTAGKIKSLSIAEDLQKQNIKPLNLLLLESYFDANAKYSNGNFFSEDTVIEGIVPTIFNKKDDGVNVIVFVKNGTDIYPVIKHPRDSEKIKDNTTDDPLILSAYWERLSKQAVISGAGAIQLFFKEVEEKRKLNPTPTLPLSKGRGLNIGMVSAFGELVKANNAVIGFFNSLQKAVASVLPQDGRTETVVDMDELSGAGETNNNEIATSPLDTLGTPRNDSNEIPLSPPFPKGEEKMPPINDVEEKYLPPPPTPPRAGGEVENIYVSRVIDGDTVTLNNGNDLRLIGMDTPELGEICADEAMQELKKLVLGKNITLEKDTSETDKYGRLLRYIYVDSQMINAEMVKNGYAKTMPISPDKKYASAFKALQDEAKFFKRGCLWGGVGGGPMDEIVSSSSTPPRNNTNDNGASYAGNPGDLGQPLPPPPTPPQAGGEDVTSTPETPTSTPESATTSTPPGTSASSTPETATSTPENSGDSSPADQNDGGGSIKIIINEIQIAGQIADDEFIELYNPNGDPADISGWNLSKNKSGTESNLVREFSANTTIPANTYFLIVSQKVTSTPADTKYSGSSFYISDDSTILLKNQNNEVIDKVGMGESQEYETTPTLNPPKNQSITRQNFQDTNNNQADFILTTSTPQGTSSTPEKSEPEIIVPPPTPDPKIVCTPPVYEKHDNKIGDADTKNANIKRLPLIPANVTTILSANTTYYIDYWDNPYVKPGAKLIIEEGVVLKFGQYRRDGNNYFPVSFRIAGSLEINGTKNNPVIFTTFRDDSHGVAINMSTSTPAPEDWGALQIESGANETIKIQNAKFYYAGGSPNTTGAAIRIAGKAAISISDTDILHSQSGIYIDSVYAGQPEIINSNFEYNRVYGLWGGSDNSPISVKIINNTFSCNGLPHASNPSGGVMIKNGAENTIIENNNFLANENFGLYYYPYKNDILSAQNNYWNDQSGPYNATSNPTGLGDPISDNINYSPWKFSSASP